jgi:cell surface protein SprA
MMFSFLSGYAGHDASGISRNTFPVIPKPNWRITYNGLAKMEILKKHFKTVTLTHAYRSSYSFSFTQNLLYTDDGNNVPTALDNASNFIFKEQINTINLTEQFSPLIKVDVTMTNKITGNVELKKDRNIALSLSNNQVTEIFGTEYIFGAGYRIPGLEIKFSKDKKKKPLKSDLNIRADLSIRRNITLIRKVVENVTQPTAGQTIISVKTSAEYTISERLNLRIFYDQILTRPVISTSFNSSNVNSGVALRFTL